MNWTYKKGLHDLGNGSYAWLAPDGSWGWSNAGLIVDGEESLLVDTLFDLPLTREMLGAMQAAEPRAAKDINTLVNTHANGDHCYGNELVVGAEIIASAASAREMDEAPPETLAAMMEMLAGDDSQLGVFMRRCFGDFDFKGISQTRPTQTFNKELQVQVGSKQVNLIEVGPAHTKGDVLVHVPEDRTVFTGDILFIDGTPIMWDGPVSNWILACDRIMAMDVETIVPGHGPVTDKKGVAAVASYLDYINSEARKRFDQGMSAFEAAKDIELGDYSSWGDSERIAVNCATLYREFAADQPSTDIVTLFSQMAELAFKK
jgi:glyoxylase-like metal-dependent hydrolase (beta-lactamase superfamily II)